MVCERFNLKSKEDLIKKEQELNILLPYSDDLSIINKSLTIDKKKVNNRIVFQPMEGCDATADGCPDDLTIRRYDRYAKSGAAIIWMEAVSISEDAKANPRQLYINADTLDSFSRLTDQIKETCYMENRFEPLVIIQLTHSGRYSKPYGDPQPIIAYNNPLFEGQNVLSEDCIITDDQVEKTEELYGQAAFLAQKAGFDGADIKSCHRYLINEFLSAYHRPGKYGGSFENRIRFLTNSVLAAKAVVKKKFIITTRLNAYDGFPYPYGFGVKENNGVTPDFSETLKLVDILHNQMGMNLMNITIGNPYVNPYVNRPSDTSANFEKENPLIGVNRILSCAKKVQTTFPQLNVISSGLSYLRQFSVNVAAGMIEQGGSNLVGFGRQTFAYPQMIKDIKHYGRIMPEKCCIACGKCTELMRAGSSTGCVVRDKDVYAALYMKSVKSLV